MNTQPDNDDSDELTAFPLEDIHGYITLGRRLAWTFVFALIIGAISAGIEIAWKAHQ